MKGIWRPTASRSTGKGRKQVGRPCAAAPEPFAWRRRLRPAADVPAGALRVAVADEPLAAMPLLQVAVKVRLRLLAAGAADRAAALRAPVAAAVVVATAVPPAHRS